MHSPRNFSLLVLGLVLAACVAGYYATGPASEPAASAPSAAPVSTGLLDRVLQLAPYACTPEEQAQAREAWRLADNAVDLAFAAAVRDAEADAAIPAAGPLRELSDRVARLKDKVEADKKQVAALGQDDSDALERAQAELALDQDELDDTREDLDRASGNQRGRLEELLQRHQASDKVADRGLAFSSPPPTGTLSQQIRAWLTVREGESRLLAAAQTASSRSHTLLAEHNAREARLNAAAPAGTASTASMRALAAERKTVSGLSQRAQDATQLSTAFQHWAELLRVRERATLHLALRSIALILVILLGAVLLQRAIVHTLRGSDRRRLHQLRTMTRIGVQVVALLLILMVVFGPPTQLSTMIGLVTAGLTVVMKDFIVAFLGWFTLMGRNGISVGDWVEIEGVSGEVIEIGLLKTVLLEVGNWTDTGHPTGRRVAFSNSFAVEGHFFNFSTTGQWLWDEVRATLPPNADPYELARRISAIVEEETREDAAAAAEDWDRVTQHHGARDFSAAPAIHLRPGQNGLEVVVRYITRAPRRNAAQAKIYADIVDLLHHAA